MSILSKLCQSCYFFVQKSEKGGLCHRYPRIYTGTREYGQKDHSYPYVQVQDWCGEWKEKDASSD